MGMEKAGRGPGFRHFVVVSRVLSLGEGSFLYFQFLSSLVDFIVRRATWDRGRLWGEV